MDKLLLNLIEDFVHGTYVCVYILYKIMSDFIIFQFLLLPNLKKHAVPVLAIKLHITLDMFEISQRQHIINTKLVK